MTHMPTKSEIRLESIPRFLPGGIRLPDDVIEAIGRFKAKRGQGYRPRTRHLDGEGNPRYMNRLFLESSPYLLQHAHNPVSLQ